MRRNKDFINNLTVHGRARYAEEEAVSKLLAGLAEQLGWNASRPFSCVKKVTGDLVFEIDVHKGARNRDYELVEVQCECNIWHRKFGRTLSANSLVGSFALEPFGRRWTLITETGQLRRAQEELLRLIRQKVLPLQEDFAADPKQAAIHLVERDLLEEYDIHLVLIELCVGEDYVLQVAQNYYDHLSAADKKRIQRHQGGETRIEGAGNLLYIADQMYVRSGLLSWKKDNPREVSAENPVRKNVPAEHRPVQEKAYYTSREEQEYMRQIRRLLELKTAELGTEYGFRSAGPELVRREEKNIFTLQITFAEKGKTLTASLGMRPAVLDSIYWGVFDFQDVMRSGSKGYELTQTRQMRDYPLEDAKAQITRPERVEDALRDVLHWAQERVLFFEEQIGSVSDFRELIAGDSTQRVNRILCEIYAKHYREAMLSAQDMIRYGISGGVAVVISKDEKRDILKYIEDYCRKKLYG